MKRRLTGLVRFILFLSIFTYACSKDLSFTDDPTGTRDIRSLNPAPIPLDTLMLDSLDDPGHR